MRQINQVGLDSIKAFEGLRLEAYQDQKGIWTIGYGHIAKVTPGEIISEPFAEQLLEYDLHNTYVGLEKLIKVPVNDNQYSALVSLAFNIGLGHLGASTLLHLVNQGAFNWASQEFIKWDHINGVQDAGLLRRRQAERDLFLKAII